MLFGGIAVAMIEGVGFDNGAVRDLLLQCFDQLARQNVGAVLFTGVQFDGNLAVNAFVD